MRANMSLLTELDSRFLIEATLYKHDASTTTLKSRPDRRAVLQRLDVPATRSRQLTKMNCRVRFRA